MGVGHGSPLWVSMAAGDVRAERFAAANGRPPPWAGCAARTGTKKGQRPRRRPQETAQGRHEPCPCPQAAAHQQSDGSPVHSCTRSTHVASDAERHGPDRDRESRHPGHRERSGFAQREPPSVSRPVSGLASGTRPVDRTFPRLPAQWCIAVPVSLTVAWAAPDWRSCPERAPASRFTPGPLRPLGHLRREAVYAAPRGRATVPSGGLRWPTSMVSVPTTLNVWERRVWISDFARSLRS